MLRTQTHARHCRFLIGHVLLLLIVSTSVIADDFALDIGVLMQRSPSHRILSQKWSGVFSQQGFAARFRSGNGGETTKLEDVQSGRTRSVRVVGILNNDGTVEFSRGHKFRLDQGQELTAWLKKLQQYGVGGPPEQNPTWGLSAEQYQAVLDLLKARVNEKPSWNNPLRYLSSLKLPDNFSLTYTDAAEQRLRQTLRTEETPDVIGLSKGTALAIGLAQFGLGFRPMPTDSGDDRFQLQIDVGGEASNLYPVGWKNNQSITVALPATARSISIDAVELPLSDLLAQVAKKLNIPFIQSHRMIQKAGLSLKSIPVTRTGRNTPFSLLRTLGNKHKLGFTFRTDEAGKIFLWATTKQEASAFRTRFQHITPGR